MEPKSPEIIQNPNIELRGKLQAVLQPLQKLINEKPIMEEEKPLSLDPDYLDLQSVNSGNGKFSFWGGIEPTGFLSDLPNKPTANIKNLRVPPKLRRKSLGTQIVSVWENTLFDQGIDIFTATNIRDEAAFEFWKKIGYKIPESQMDKKIPYCMYKLRPQNPTYPEV